MALLVLVLLSLGPIRSPASAQPPSGEPTAPPSTGPAGLTLVEQSPFVEPDGELLLRLAIPDPPPGGVLELAVHERVTGRIQLTEGLTSGPGGEVIGRRCTALLDTGPASLPTCRIPLADADLDDDGALTIAVPLRADAEGPDDRLLLADEGVYPLTITLTGEDGAERDRLITHLIRLPSSADTAEALPVALLLPVGAPPALRTDGSTELAEIDLDRLRTVADALDQQRDVPLALLLEPETMNALAVESDETAAVLETLRGALDTRQVLARPYVDLDVASWWDAGLDAELDDQLATGRDRVAELLETRPDRRTWVMEPTTDPATLSRLRELGVDQVVVPEELLATLDEGDFPIALDQPFAVATDTGATVPAVADDMLLRSHAGSTGDPKLDAHHLLADLAVLYFQRPGIARGTALSIPPAALEEPEYLTTLLDGLAQPSVIRASTLDDLFETASPAREGGTGDREGPVLVRPVASTEAPDLGSYPEALRAAAGDLAVYRSLLGDEAGAPVEDLLRVSGWRGLTPDEQGDYLDAAVEAVDQLVEGVAVPAQPAVTLTAREGLIPVRLRNDLGRPVNVAVQLRSDKLEFPEGDVVTTTLEPGETRLEWPVETRASGAFPVEVLITSPDGDLELDENRFTMRSTAVPGIGLVLSALAALFLLVWWARHWRTARRARGLVAPHHPSHRAVAEAERDRLIDEITEV